MGKQARKIEWDAKPITFNFEIKTTQRTSLQQQQQHIHAQ